VSTTELQRPLTDAVIEQVLRRKPMHRKFLKRALQQLAQDEQGEVERYLGFMREEGLGIEQIAQAYITIVDDTFREELYFRETGRYRFSTFAQAREAVYDNPVYMRDYMVGLALSSFWWANHTEMRRFFKAQLPAMRGYTGLYREVGPGHGMFFLESMRHGQFRAYEGLDISATSIGMTRRITESGYFGRFEKARFVQADFLADTPIEPAEVLVMGEVLEHVEDPAAFLRRAHATTTPDCRFFLSTCINAPAVDHLYNPGSVQTLEALFGAHGFEVRERCVIGRDGAPLEQCERERLAINVAYLLAKRAG
jgi:SAM-dependent methyltransferase